MWAPLFIFLYQASLVLAGTISNTLHLPGQHYSSNPGVPLWVHSTQSTCSNRLQSGSCPRREEGIHQCSCYGHAQTLKLTKGAIAWTPNNTLTEAVARPLSQLCKGHAIYQYTCNSCSPATIEVIQNPYRGQPGAPGSSEQWGLHYWATQEIFYIRPFLHNWEIQLIYLICGNKHTK